tara:strand:+ start:722 stop:1117 length:396 start_codon:yes stop_codon:yes gene_type:complete
MYKDLPVMSCAEYDNLPEKCKQYYRAKVAQSISYSPLKSKTQEYSQGPMYYESPPLVNYLGVQKSKTSSSQKHSKPQQSKSFSSHHTPSVSINRGYSGSYGPSPYGGGSYGGSSYGGSSYGGSDSSNNRFI